MIFLKTSFNLWPIPYLILLVLLIYLSRFYQNCHLTMSCLAVTGSYLSWYNISNFSSCVPYSGSNNALTAGIADFVTCLLSLSALCFSDR